MMHRLPMAGVFAGAVALFLSALAPAASAQDGGLFGNLFKPPGQVQDHAQGAETAELVTRMERLENALRQLTGQVEQLQYRNQQLEAQVRRLEEGGGPARPPGAAGGSAAPQNRPPLAPAAGRRSDVFDPSAEPGAPGAPQPLGSPASASAGLARPHVGPAGAPMGPLAGAQVAALPGPGATPRELYEAGQGQIQRQDFAGAEQTFRQIIQTGGTDRLVPDATFMLGESLFLQKSYKDAANSFLDLTVKYPNSLRAPEALLRVGQSLAILGEKEAACATLLEVDRKYPRAPAGVRQAVEREQKRVGC
ncbi:tol-pal system protein YbgF [Xanthobacter sp. KR7-225]|uniref:tol-pal system protein YbgF n=1 Tax=Xanthobacter sp. KR7-225 TaxID=3156613 RepID=UPI0032B37F3F